MKIAVLTDSAAYVSKEEQQKYHIDVIPIPIIWHHRSYRDLIDIGYHEFYQKLATSQDLPTTSEPSVGEFKTFIDHYVAQNYTDVIVLPLSSGISNFYNNVANFAEQEKRIKIHPFDCHITCAGEADAAILAARLVQAGASWPLIKHDLIDLRKTMGLRFLVDDLNHLKRTGRLSNAATFVGGLLKIKPILSMDVRGEGKISAIAKERKYGRAYSHVQKDFARLIKDVPYPVQSTIFDADDEKREQAWLSDYQQKFPQVKFKKSIIGPVVGVHTGRHAMSMIWCRDLDSYFDNENQPILDIDSPSLKD